MYWFVFLHEDVVLTASPRHFIFPWHLQTVVTLVGPGQEQLELTTSWPWTLLDETFNESTFLVQSFLSKKLLVLIFFLLETGSLYSTPTKIYSSASDYLHKMIITIIFELRKNFALALCVSSAEEPAAGGLEQALKSTRIKRKKLPSGLGQQWPNVAIQVLESVRCQEVRRWCVCVCVGREGRRVSSGRLGGVAGIGGRLVRLLPWSVLTHRWWNYRSQYHRKFYTLHGKETAIFCAHVGSITSKRC